MRTSDQALARTVINGIAAGASYIVTAGNLGATVIVTARALALDNGHMEPVLRAYNNLYAVLLAEENERALKYGEKGFELAKKVGHIIQKSWIGTNLAYGCVARGNARVALLAD